MIETANSRQIRASPPDNRVGIAAGMLHGDRRVGNVIQVRMREGEKRRGWAARAGPLAERGVRIGGLTSIRIDEPCTPPPIWSIPNQQKGFAKTRAMDPDIERHGEETPDYDAEKSLVCWARHSAAAE